MSLPHPFVWLSDQNQSRAFWALLPLTLLMAGIMAAVGKPLITATAPLGILSFEFAGNLPAAQAMVDSWGPEGRVYAGLSLGLDYLFLVLYASSIALACVLIARRSRFLPLLGILLAWAQIDAALLDAVENYGLLQILLGSGGESWPVVAWWCALLKFLTVGLGLAYVLVALLSTLRKKPGDPDMLG